MQQLHVDQGKSKQHQKAYQNDSQEPNNCLFLEVTGPFPLTIGRSKYDAKIVDLFSQNTWTAHIKTKTQITDLVKQHLLGHNESLRENGKTFAL